MAAALLGLLAAWWVPAWVEHTINAHLQQRLLQQGIDARWRRLSWTLGGRVSLQEVEVRDPGRGIDARLAQMTVRVAPWAALTGTLRLGTIELEGLTGALDLSAWRRRPKVVDAAPKRQRARALKVRLTNARWLVLDEGRTLGEVAISDARLVMGDAGVHVEGMARGQAYGYAFGGRVDASLDRKSGRIEIDLKGIEGAPLIGRLRAASRLTVADLQLRVVRGRAGFELKVGRIEAGLGLLVWPQIAGTMASASVRWTGEMLSVTLGHTRIQAKRETLRRLAEKALAPRKPKMDLSVSGAPRAGRGWRLPVAKLAVSIEDLTLTDTDHVTLLGGLRATFADGELALDTTTLGGHLSGQAGWTSGLWPSWATVTFDGLSLAAFDTWWPAPSPPHRDRARLRAGQVSGGVHLELNDTSGRAPLGEGGRMVFDVAIAGGQLDAPGLDAAVVDGLEGAVSGILSQDTMGAWALRGHLGAGALRAELSAKLSPLTDDPVLTLKASLPRTACQRGYDSLPDALVGPYRGATFKGLLAPRVLLRWPLDRPAALGLKITGLIGRCESTGLNAAKRAWPRVRVPRGVPLDDVTWLNSPFVRTVREGVSRPVKVGPGLDTYVPLAELPPYVGAAAYLSEQMAFYTGGAISPGLIERALRTNLAGGRFVYGGSTVTQQLVKNLFLSRDKTLVRKLREAVVAGRVLDVVSRDRILELYLNCIEFGPDVYGIGPAARRYFQKDARDLTPNEAIFLAMLKPAPAHGAGMVRRGRSAHYPWWDARAVQLMARLVEAGALSQAAADAAGTLDLRWDKAGTYQP